MNIDFHFSFSLTLSGCVSRVGGGCGDEVQKFPMKIFLHVEPQTRGARVLIGGCRGNDSQTGTGILSVHEPPIVIVITVIASSLLGKWEMALSLQLGGVCLFSWVSVCLRESLRTARWGCLDVVVMGKSRMLRWFGNVRVK